ncbi:hypothetical protein DLAC_07178 [Tieghemostelium lacteum]|uniref:Uncharacterized protein n=1 Tax=Tieghemostelium lacteum TaxID=361077 RepID=A0A151ZDA4_TIELA|nr:hypothetical protein DLAC_07178 [Tieghemostelium lacteum]|eukprot:KYQ91938.1 hypothetical protein DLAC_07178 [Tieghemostelium lacteum]
MSSHYRAQLLKNMIDNLKTLYAIDIPVVHNLKERNLVSRVIDFYNPITGDPTAKFINISSTFVGFYTLKNFIFAHHDHQDVQYPYMKSKRRTLAFMFENKH